MKEKQKRKSGVARLFEIAGEKKGLLILAGILSAVSALCMLVPYWSVYEVLKELLLHGSKINELDSSVLMHWGWVAFIGLVAGLLLLYGALMASHVAAHPFVRTYRTTFAGIPEWYFYRSNQENDGAEYREDREFCGTHDSRFSQCAGNRCADVYHFFFAERVDGSHLCGLYRLQHRFAVYEFLWQES